MWDSTLYVLMGTIGYCIIFKVKPKSIVPAAVTSCLGWLVRTILVEMDFSEILATFFGAMAIALLGEIFARLLKDAATVFTIPGIIPMVPGASLYYTMLYFIQGDSSRALQAGQITLFTAGAIALGILVISSLFRIIGNVERSVKRRGKD